MEARAVMLLLGLAGCDQLFGIGTFATSDAKAGVSLDAPPISSPVCMSDDFDSTVIDTTHWKPFDDMNVTIGVVAKAFDITLTGNMPANRYGGMTTVARYDLTDGWIGMEVLQVLVQAQGAEVELYLYLDANDQYLIDISQSMLQFETYVAGQEALIGEQTYDPVMHRFLRIRDDSAASQVVFEAGPDGTSWPTYIATPATIPVTALYGGFDAGTYQTVTDPGTAIFDSLVIAAPACAP